MSRALSIILLFPSLLSAQLVRVSPADPVKNGVFGHAVDIDRQGRIALVGSPGANIREDIEDFSGTAYVFTREDTRWSQLAKLVPVEIGRNDAFGSSVALSADGSLAVVGAPLASTEGYASGAAYIFNCDTSGCQERARLVPPSLESGDLFGMSVALDDSGAVVVIGAPGYQDYAGVVWIFRREGPEWSDGAMLHPETPESMTFFGRAVAISADGRTIWAGEPLHRQRPPSLGAVHVFTEESGQWRRDGILHPDDPTGTSMFGYALALSRGGSFGAVGAPGVGTPETSRGFATAFRRQDEGWQSVETFHPPNPAEAFWFGSSVEVDTFGTFVVVGAPGDARNGFRSGRAFVFADWSGTWSPVLELEPDSASTDDRFGFSMALDAIGRYGFIGARESPVNEFDAGLAHAIGPSIIPVSVKNPVYDVAGDAASARNRLELRLYPNPNREQCRVTFKTPEPGVASVRAYDSSGRKVATVYERASPGGWIDLVWDTSGLPPGVYVVRLRSGDREQVVTMVHAR